MTNTVKTLLPEFIKTWYQNLLSPLIKLLIRLKIHPSYFTITGLIITGISAFFLARGDLLTGGILILVGGTFDIIDGKVARATGYASRFGALFDSTLDRYSEVFAFFGVGFYFVAQQMYLSSIATFVALGGSMMVSYIRARAEGLNFECKAGLMQRPERVVALGFGAIFGETGIIVAVTIIAVFANITAIQRVILIRKLDKTKNKGVDSNEDNITKSENS